MPARLDHRNTAWERVERATYVVRQTVRYDYSAPATHLRQRLMLVPPAQHGDQRRVGWLIEASIPARRRLSHDRFGNVSVDFRVDALEGAVTFDAHVVVERAPRSEPRVPHPHRSLGHRSALTAADAELEGAAADLVGAGYRDLDLAERICDWTSRRLVYRHDVTSIATTAIAACQAGAGVCQDFSHVMLAVCRQAGMSARYVSGHLLGEGPSHAWVEVLLPRDDGRSWTSVAFDPTHARRAGGDYVTIATGRDYRDVAPTSGSCFSAQPGSLTTSKDAFLTATV